MIKISKKIEYSLMVLKHMHRVNNAKTTTAREICDSYGAPFNTISKVMQTLSKNQILISHQGATGGYTLNKDLSELSYSKLLEIIEGRAQAKDCIELNCSLFSSCNVISPIRKLNQHLNSFISSISLAELFDEGPTASLTTKGQI